VWGGSERIQERARKKPPRVREDGGEASGEEVVTACCLINLQGIWVFGLVFCCFRDGQQDAKLMKWSPDDLKRLATREFVGGFGVSGECLLVEGVASSEMSARSFCRRQVWINLGKSSGRPAAAGHARRCVGDVRIVVSSRVHGRPCTRRNSLCIFFLKRMRCNHPNEGMDMVVWCLT
jgi:hypothetical protein